MQIAQASQQLQMAQRMQTHNARAASPQSEEANESGAERAAEAQKNAVAHSTGVGINLDIKG